jgi:NAD(P)-dependent dehydrogenase (short-subunit alcohol dehydrogenase family)
MSVSLSLWEIRHPKLSAHPDIWVIELTVVPWADYSCSKAALQSGFIRTVKNEIVQIAPAGRINAVSPGWVRTPMAEATMSDPGLVERAIATCVALFQCSTADSCGRLLESR